MLRYPSRRPGFRGWPGDYSPPAPTTILGVSGYLASTNYFASAGTANAMLKATPWSLGVMMSISANPAGSVNTIVGRSQNTAAGGGAFLRVTSGGLVTGRIADGTTTADTANSSALTANSVYLFVMTHDGSNIHLIQQAGEIGSPVAASYKDPDTVGMQLTSGVRAVNHDQDCETLKLFGIVTATAAMSAAQVATWAAACKVAMDVVDFPASPQCLYSVREGLGGVAGAAPSTWADENAIGLTKTLAGSLAVTEVTPTWGN